MKRILSLLCAAAVISAAVLCGCGSDQGSSGAGGSSQSSAQDGGTVAPTTAQPLTDSTVKTTGGKVHITDNTLGDIWISELEGVALNKLNADGFTSDAAFKYYSEGGKPASEEGIDISSFSGKVDWVQVKESGVDFAMIRLGGRSYGAEGKLYTDDSSTPILFSVTSSWTIRSPTTGRSSKTTMRALTVSPRRRRRNVPPRSAKRRKRWDMFPWSIPQAGNSTSNMTSRVSRTTSSGWRSTPMFRISITNSLCGSIPTMERSRVSRGRLISTSVSRA